MDCSSLYMITSGGKRKPMPFPAVSPFRYARHSQVVGTVNRLCDKAFLVAFFVKVSFASVPAERSKVPVDITPNDHAH